MEDTATAEICRAQLWQWVHNKARLEDGRRVTLRHVRHDLKQELAALKAEVGPEMYGTGHYELAAQLFDLMISSEEFREFLTLVAYPHLLKLEDGQKSARADATKKASYNQLR